MTAATDFLTAVAAAQEVEVTSYRRNGELRRWVPIWAVQADGELYLRSAFGADGGWYKWAMQTGKARLRLRGDELDVTLTPVSDEAINVAVDDAYRTKYARQQSSMNIMIGDVARPSTVRVAPSA